MNMKRMRSASAPDTRSKRLSAGNVGCIITGIKESNGDQGRGYRHPRGSPLCGSHPGFEDVKPMVFCRHLSDRTTMTSRPRDSLESAAQRCFPDLRTRNWCPGLWFSVWFPGHAAPRDRAGRCFWEFDQDVITTVPTCPTICSRPGEEKRSARLLNCRPKPRFSKSKSRLSSAQIITKPEFIGATMVCLEKRGY